MFTNRVFVSAMMGVASLSVTQDRLRKKPSLAAWVVKRLNLDIICQEGREERDQAIMATTRFKIRKAYFPSISISLKTLHKPRDDSFF